VVVVVVVVLVVLVVCCSLGQGQPFRAEAASSAVLLGTAAVVVPAQSHRFALIRRPQIYCCCTGYMEQEGWLAVAE
jgi:hypothetical protein